MWSRQLVRQRLATVQQRAVGTRSRDGANFSRKSSENKGNMKRRPDSYCHYELSRVLDRDVQTGEQKPASARPFRGAARTSPA